MRARTAAEMPGCWNCSSNFLLHRRHPSDRFKKNDGVVSRAVGRSAGVLPALRPTALAHPNPKLSLPPILFILNPSPLLRFPRLRFNIGETGPWRRWLCEDIFLAVISLVSLLACGAFLAANNYPSGAEPSKPCDRACLERFVDQYLAALVAHNYSKLPLAKNVRYTENGQDLKMNDGMWQVATLIGNKKLCFADPQTGQIGYRGIVEENGRKQIVMTRIKVDNQKISEIEALVLRGGSFNNPDGLEDHPLFKEPLLPATGLREKS